MFYYTDKKVGRYEFASICRNDERKCGSAGKYYVEKNK
jgi:hypothetical protein